MGARAQEAAARIAYVESLQPTGGVATTSSVQQAKGNFGEQARGGVGIYGIEATGYPAGAVTTEGEYTYEATQRPTRTRGAVSQSPLDILKINRATGERKATRQPPPIQKSPLLDMSDDQLNEMVLMGNAAGGEAQQIGMEAERILRNRGEESALSASSRLFPLFA